MTVIAYVCTGVNGCETNVFALLIIAIAWFAAVIRLLSSAARRQTATAFLLAVVGIVFSTVLGYYLTILAILGAF